MDATNSWKGRILIISGFAGIGKTKATSILNTLPGYEVHDVDSAPYREEFKGLEGDNFYRAYACAIAKRYDRAMSRRNVMGGDETIIYFVSAHYQVRKWLDKMGLPFIYVAPHPNDIVMKEEMLLRIMDRGNQPGHTRGDGRAATWARTIYSDPEAMAKLGADESKLAMQRNVYVTKAFPYMLDIALRYTKRDDCDEEYQDLLSDTIMNKFRNRIRDVINDDPGKVTYGVTSNGRFYAVTDTTPIADMEELIAALGLDHDTAKRLANVDKKYVVLDWADAKCILYMLNDAISRLESGARSDNDVEVFGETAISYERLIDQLDCSYLPACIDGEKVD